MVHDSPGFPGGEDVGGGPGKKQTEVKGFRGKLESHLDAKVEDLTPKTKLQGYYEHDYESFSAVLKKNQKDAGYRSVAPGAGRGPQSQVRGIASQASTAAREDQADR
ncbi:MAG: hypothetical protein M0Q43_12725 [Methanothrix sp.]|nr:hypothetical protein [Methanothrix sp.]